jgi:hypothetical protein
VSDGKPASLLQGGKNSAELTRRRRRKVLGSARERVAAARLGQLACAQHRFAVHGATHPVRRRELRNQVPTARERCTNKSHGQHIKGTALLLFFVFKN